MNTQQNLTVIDGETLIDKRLPPTRFCVDSLIPQGLCILGGAPKVGKSWFVLDLCVHIARGEALWELPVTKGEVLYFCLEDSELKLLIDGMLQSKHITAKHSKDLIEKLCGLSNKYFRSHVKNVYSVNDWSTTENQALFYNIEVVDEAIASGKQVQYDYNKYGVDAKLHKSSFQRVSPYQLILHNQRFLSEYKKLK